MHSRQPADFQYSPSSRLSYADEMAVAMRLAGFAAAFAERCIELQVTLAVRAVREWSQLFVAAQRASGGLVGGSLPAAFGGPAAQPSLAGRRRGSSRRSQSVVINFPERRSPSGA